MRLNKRHAWRCVVTAIAVFFGTRLTGDDAKTRDTDTDSVARLASELDDARRLFDDARMARVIEQGNAIREERSEASFALEALIARAHVFRANMLRTERTIRKLDGATVKSHRAKQAEWGAAGLPHAEAALSLATRDADRATAERLLGELWVHQISGPISGILNGPKALSHITQALKLAPDDPECQRAQGLMFLYNPPINGGDVNKAIKTFRRCSEKVPASDEYLVYLALAFRKKGNLLRAEVAAKKALDRNSSSRDARLLLESLEVDRALEKGEEAQ